MANIGMSLNNVKRVSSKKSDVFSSRMIFKADRSAKKEYIYYKERYDSSNKNAVLREGIFKKVGDSSYELLEPQNYRSMFYNLDLAQDLDLNYRDDLDLLEENPFIESEEDDLPPIQESTTTEREYTPENITSLNPNEVFVFGSNAEGAHGKGAALIAKQKFGAIQGQAEGLQGQSYAIITKKDWRVEKSSTLTEIGNGIMKFVSFASRNPDKKFYVTKIASSLAGYTIPEIKNLWKQVNEVWEHDMFYDIPNNIILPKEFEMRDNEPQAPVNEAAPVLNNKIEPGRYVNYNNEIFIVTKININDTIQIYNPTLEGTAAKKSVAMRNLKLLNSKAEIVKHKESSYIVTPKETIISLTSNKVMKWGEENGDRKEILLKSKDKATTEYSAWNEISEEDRNDFSKLGYIEETFNNLTIEEQNLLFRCRRKIK